MPCMPCAAICAAMLEAVLSAPLAISRVASKAAWCVPASRRACAAICWNWLVSAPHHCIGSALVCSGAASSSGGVRALRAAEASLAGDGASGAGAGAGAGVGGEVNGNADGGSAARAAGRSLSWPAAAPKLAARSPIATFISCSVASVIFCTSSACTVAARARAFCSSQNCTALRSWMRLSSSSTLTVGATQPDSPGMVGIPAAAPLARFCRKSNPGTKRPKPKGVLSLMACSWCIREWLHSLPACAPPVRHVRALYRPQARDSVVFSRKPA